MRELAPSVAELDGPDAVFAANADLLSRCRFPVGSREKRFAQALPAILAEKGIGGLTIKQREYANGLIWRYRRQIRRIKDIRKHAAVAWR